MSKEKGMEHFGQKLRALRMHHSLTLKELAHKLGYSAHGYISEIESGKKVPTVEFALKVADFFRVTTDQLLQDEIKLSLRHAHKN